MAKNWKSRDKKRNKRRYGHRVTGRSVFLSQYLAWKRAQKAKKETQNE